MDSSPTTHTCEAELDPQNLEKGYHITQCERNSQGHGNSGLNTPCDIIPSDINPPGEEWGYGPSLFYYWYASPI